MIARRYMRDVLPTLARQTQRDYTQYLVPLEKVFGEVAIDSIRPYDVAEYLRIRGMNSKVRANRERALLSTIFNHARAWGYTDITNSCSGIKVISPKGDPLTSAGAG